ncbi:hypothetical protein JW777_01985 [bacterium]|nr:hypothetical protein [bacterium]
MNRRFLIGACLLCASLTAFAQPAQGPSGITFSGFVKTDVLADSRQTVALREGHFLLYPSPALMDSLGTDINAKANFNMLSIQTRLAGKIAGPDALGAKTSGLIEGEFFGTSDADISGFRVRHAFLKLDWAASSLLIGQFWHPMFVVEMFPGVVSFNTGAPFQAFSRNPQIRFTRNLGGIRLIAAALSQRDFQSNGPAGFTSAYLRNSVVPNLHGQVQISGGGHLFGFGFDHKTVTPRLVTTRNVATDASLGSTAFLGYAKLAFDRFCLKAEGITGGNLADHLMLGGYAVRSTDPATGVETYTALKSASAWGEVSTGKDLEFACFAGVSKNLGADEPYAGAVYGRGANIDRLWRISPRVVWNTGKVRFSAEAEYSSADYGTPSGAQKGKVENVRSVANGRLLFAAHYFF